MDIEYVWCECEAHGSKAHPKHADGINCINWRFAFIRRYR